MSAERVRFWWLCRRQWRVQHSAAASMSEEDADEDDEAKYAEILDNLTLQRDEVRAACLAA